MITGEWTDPQRGKIALRTYTEKWIAQRPNLRARTVELYSWLLAKHIGPYLGRVSIGKITPDMVRTWRAELLSNGVSISAAAKAYRLLRAVLMTAAEDRIIPRNPCRIRGGGYESRTERPVLAVAQVFELAELMKDRRYRALVLLVTFASLRWGEAIALRRCDIDLDTRTVSVRRQYIERPTICPRAAEVAGGIRTVGIPKRSSHTARALRHLRRRRGNRARVHRGCAGRAAPEQLPTWRGLGAAVTSSAYPACISTI